MLEIQIITMWHSSFVLFFYCWIRLFQFGEVKIQIAIDFAAIIKNISMTHRINEKSTQESQSYTEVRL